MTDYPIDMQLVVDPLNPENVVRSGTVYLYDPSDEAGVSPIALKDPSGLPLGNPLTSNAFGFTQPFIAQIPAVRWKSGTFEGFFYSYDGLRNEAIAARAAAEVAQAAATTAGADAAGVASAALAGAVANAQAAQTAAQAAAALVAAPSDVAVKTLVQNPASQTAAALAATFVPKWKATTAYLAGDAVLNPSGDMVTAKVNFTSGASYDASNWNYSAVYGPTAAPMKSAFAKGTLASGAFSSGRKVATVGASITNGSSSSNAGTMSYVARYSYHAGTAYVNNYTNLIIAGYPGNTSTAITSHLSEVMAQKPDMLVIGPDFGTNGAASETLATYQANLLQWVRAGQQAGIPVIVCTTLPRASAAAANLHEGYRRQNLWLHLWARRSQSNGGGGGVYLVDTFAATVDPTTGYLAAAYDSGDGVHPNDAGHEKMSQAIVPAIVAARKGERLPLPWIVSSKLPSFGLFPDPLMSSTAGWNVQVVGSTAAVLAGNGTDNLPGGNWFQLTVDNSAGGSTINPARYKDLTGGGLWAPGDTLAIAFYTKSNKAASGMQVRFEKQGPTLVNVLRQGTKALGNGLPDLLKVTVPSDATTLRIMFYSQALAGENVVDSLGALEVFNLTAAGLTDWI